MMQAWRSRVYPRVCGGTASHRCIGTPDEGLSPRVRGNRLRHRGTGGGGRSIPACAGEPMARTWASALSPVYPRVCGGTPSLPTTPTPALGLSPRVRGNRPPQTPHPAAARSIPACAGEPTTPKSPLFLIWVYPRVCGGTAVMAVWTAHWAGLSPRVRGNPAPLPVLRIGVRSIPACAGEPPIIAGDCQQG